ncbi:hypothetical protein [Gemmiger sp.]
MKYKILRIDEQLYGCEEPPTDAPLLVDVTLEDTDGRRRVLPYPDETLRADGIDEGDFVEILENRLVKVQ